VYPKHQKRKRKSNRLKNAQLPYRAILPSKTDIYSAQLQNPKPDTHRPLLRASQLLKMFLIAAGFFLPDSFEERHL
jgi:hypothetical protein